MRRPGQPKNKISRRLGFDVYGTGGASLQRRLETPPGGRRRGRRRESRFGEQLREKQKVKAIYGLDERALRRQLEAASGEAGPPGENLLTRLERRLDNVVYRLGFAKTRPMARQLVVHGHVLVNAQRVSIPSALVDVGQRISLVEGAQSIPAVQESLEEGRPIPSWLEAEGSTKDGGRTGRVVRQVRRDDVELPIDERLVVEFFQR